MKAMKWRVLALTVALACLPGAVWASGSLIGWGDRLIGPGLSPPFAKVAAGGFHSLALRPDGSIAAWGNNEYGQCNVPSPNTAFVAIAAGGTHSLGLKSDGSVVAWGNNEYGQCQTLAPNTAFVAISAGSSFSVGLRSDGSIGAWGDNRWGQCNVPLPNTGFVAVTAGSGQCIGVKANGMLVAWGTSCTLPSPNSGFIAAAPGGTYTLGLKADGSVAMGGWTPYPDCNIPSIYPDSGVVAVAVSQGSGVSLRLTTGGRIMACGDNLNSQLNVPSPNAGFVAAAAGGYHCLGLKSDGSIVSWGSPGSPVHGIPPPNAGFLSVAPRFGLKSDGSVGWGDYGPLSGTGWVAFACSTSHSVGLRSDGSVVQHGGFEPGPPPLPSPNSGFMGVAAGYRLGLGVRTDGTLAVWGDNTCGRYAIPTPNSGFAAVAAGENHCLGVRLDGTVTAWGDNSYGQCSVPAPNTDNVAVAAGRSHGLALKWDGSIVGWGSNGSGGCTPPSPNTGFVAVAAGDYHSLGLKVDGSVVAWGDNYYKQCNVPSPNTGFIAVIGADRYTVAVKGTLSPAEAKLLPNNACGLITNATVTATGPDYFYLESADRSSGIRVERASHGLIVGDVVNAGGPVYTNSDGERTIRATATLKTGTMVPVPVAMAIGSIGGGDVRFSAATRTGQEGVFGWQRVKTQSGKWEKVWQKSHHLNTIGMLIRAWGRFTYVDPSTFTIDDGSDIRVKCTVPSGVTLDQGWQYVSVTGVVSCERSGNELKPVIELRSQSDLVVLKQAAEASAAPKTKMSLPRLRKRAL